GELLQAVEALGSDRYRVRLEADGLLLALVVAVHGDRLDVDGPFGGVEFTEVDPLPEPGSSDAVGSLAAPMPGTVVRVEVAAGDAVDAGDAIIVLEAMKMEHSVRSPQQGVVESVLVAAGDQVDVGQVLAVVADAPS